jgi:small neutral amino acid transporter SnatA (MarC family)
MVCGVLLMQVSGGTSLKHCWRDATKAVLTVLVILILSALLGKQLLQVFGISIEAFEIVGGVIIAGLPVTILVGSVCAVFLTWIIMLLVVVAEDRINKAMQHLFTRFMGLILISMGLQFVLTGWKAFMGG